MVPSVDVPVDVYSFVSPAMDAVPIDAVDPLAPLILPLYTHFAVDAAPATVHWYMFHVLVFRYKSFTNADDTPELLNTVAVVDVPVTAVPQYICDPRAPVNPVSPLILQTYTQLFAALAL